MLLLQLMINGLQVGALYALTAVGFSLIFGSTKVFHFAHGSTFTIAAYVFYWLYSIANLHWILATMAAAVCAVAFGVFMDRCV
jgi:branched-chain amino acid transport system permease protein